MQVSLGFIEIGDVEDIDTFDENVILQEICRYFNYNLDNFTYIFNNYDDVLHIECIYYENADFCRYYLKFELNEKNIYIIFTNNYSDLTKNVNLRHFILSALVKERQYEMFLRVSELLIDGDERKKILELKTYPYTEAVKGFIEYLYYHPDTCACNIFCYQVMSSSSPIAPIYYKHNYFEGSVLLVYIDPKFGPSDDKLHNHGYHINGITWDMCLKTENVDAWLHF